MTIAVVGGGGWGTALAALLAGKGHAVRLWVYEEDLAERMRRTRENDRFLPGVSVPKDRSGSALSVVARRGRFATP